MNLGNLSHRFVAPMLALGVAGAISLLGPQSASAQEITATPRFPFPSITNNTQPKHISSPLYPWSSFHSECGWKKEHLSHRPEGRGPFGSSARLTFCKSKGHNELLAVYIPGTDMTAELIAQIGFKR